MAEILPGVHQIVVNYNGRPLKLYLLVGPEASLLMDTGDAPVPDRDIAPYMASIGLDPARLTYILATHPDVDHSGGLHRMRQLAPGATFLCGTADRLQIESPQAIVEQRYRAFYRDHGLGPDDAAREKLLPRCGGYTPIDVTFTGGETLRLGPGNGPLDLLEILHLPGHSHGHLGVYLPAYKAAIIGDAVHGRYTPFFDGNPALPPTYFYIDEYLGTLARLGGMAGSGRLERLYSCHWPDCTKVQQVQAFLSQSREYCIAAEKYILDLVQAAPGGLTLRDVCLRLRPALGAWPAERDLDARNMAAGHLAHLLEHHLIAQVSGTPPKYMA